MKITANIIHRGFSLTSVDAKTLKMRGSKLLDLPSTSVMDWAQDRESVEKDIEETYSYIVVAGSIKFGSISVGQYQIGTMVNINAEIVENKEIARQALDIQREHREKVKKKDVLLKQVDEVKKNADKEIKELRKSPDFKFNRNTYYKLM